MFHVLGIDAGGTKTVCHLADEHGRLVAEARGPGANLQTAGELQVEKVLHDLMEDALGDRAIVPAAICLGIAGVDRTEDSAVVKSIMRRIGYKARTLVVNDALIALEAGAPGAAGVVILSGTGSIAYGRNVRGEGSRAGGWGHVLADEGSGYWIGVNALRAVLRHFDQRGPRTQLTALVLEHFGISEPPNLIQHVYQHKLSPHAISALVSQVQIAFDAGDDVATAIFRGAADELESLGLSVATRLGLGAETFPFILGGGILRTVQWLRDELRRRLSIAMPNGDVRLLTREPAAGAVSLAIQEVQGGARIPVYGLD